MSAQKSSNAALMNQVIESVKARGWITHDEASQVIAEIGATQGTVRRFLRRIEAAGVEVTVSAGVARALITATRTAAVHTHAPLAVATVYAAAQPAVATE